MVQELSSEKMGERQVSAVAAWYQALTLPERLDTLRRSVGQGAIEKPDNPELAERRMQKWKQQAPFEKDTYFADRLAKDGLTETELLYLLGESSESLQARIAEIPAWMMTLEQILATSDSAQNFEFLDAAKSQKSALFLRILKPLLKYGLDRLQGGVEQLVAQYQSLPFQPEKVAQLVLPGIPNALFGIVLKTFTLELNIERLQGNLSGETPEERFEDFVRRLSDSAALRALFERYPVMARALLIVIDHWVTYSLEFLSHLCADWQEICTHLAEGDPGFLAEVHMGAGDTHRQGRTVIRLAFSSGFRLIYKPRSLSIDTHFYSLLHWLNEQGAQPAFRTLRVIARDDYGWVEFVEPQTCDSAEEVARFYERLGGYLAILYMLGSNDFHHENLIACGEHPMLIDLESLIAPEMSLRQPFQSRGASALRGSVMRIGLLPSHTWGNDEAAGIDISGVGGKGGQMSPHHINMPDEAGTDQMRMVRQRVQLQGSKNQPTLQGEAVEFLAYQDQFLHGFTSIYRLFLDQRDLFLQEILPIFAQDSIRVIPRATKTYAIVLQESLHPTLLHNALLRARFFDQIWQSVPDIPGLSRLIPAEIADLHVHDIPFFTSRPGTRHVYTSRGECLEDFFAEPALEDITRRVQQLGEQDLTRQIWFIQASFATVSLGGESTGERRLHRYAQTAKKPVGRERLLQVARSVGDRICDLALHGQDEVSWLSLHHFKEREWSIVVTSIDLYDGLAGIALFLAYLGAITQEEKYTELARMALRTIQQQIAATPEQVSMLGAFSGGVAPLYLYAHLGVLWQEPELFCEAEKLLEQVDKPDIKDEVFGILSGSSGTILNLLSLYSVAPSPRTLQTAIKYGDHLLAHAVPLAQGRGWIETRMTKPLAGFSHGSGGIALSLFALANASGEERFRQAALDALAYERSTFSPQAQNWPDLRADEESYMVAWCHGASGIGLARLASLAYNDDPAMREEIAIALETTLASGFGHTHSLCHGDLGNLEVLLTASQLLHDARSHAEVERLSALILEDIEQNGWCTGAPKFVETPGLMVGIAGIGYELLRLAEPELVPSVLTLAAPVVSQPIASLKEE
jgi:type 2 lantibiotic biosynthesis protein LanM